MCYSWFSFDEAITFKLCFSIHSQTLLSKSNLWIFYLRKVSLQNLEGKKAFVVPSAFRIGLLKFSIAKNQKFKSVAKQHF